MTPNNIVNMACLKGLDIIAITDHNSAENVQAVIKSASGKKLVVVPGMEVETKEEVHLVCLFPSFDSALRMQDIIHAALPDRRNREDIFGRQLIMDEHDGILSESVRFLLTAANISIKDVVNAVLEMGGAVIPAHADRTSCSIISNLGIMPEYPDIKYLELSKGCSTKEFLQKYPYLYGYEFIKSSDAHRLGDILEREDFIDLPELSISCLLNALRK